MSYQENRLREITDAIRSVTGSSEKIKGTNIASEVAKLKNPSGTLLIEENGTFDVTNYANAEVDINIVTPSGIKTITENGTYDVKNYSFAEVNVEADLNERVIIGKWSNGADTTINFQNNGILSVNMAGNLIDGTYTINNLEITITTMGVDEILVYNDEDDFLYFKQDVSQTQKFTRVGTTLITKEITENGTYNASDDGADGYSSVTVNVASSGGGGSGGGFDRTFANNTPEQISQVSALISYNNMTSAQVAETFGWNIGDTTDITLTTGEVIQMRITGFNHDTRTNGNKAGITLEMTHCLKTLYVMNTSSSNAGGYATSKIKTETLPAVKATLPQEWQNIIKFVDKKSANGGGSNYSAILTISEDLFLLSEIEVTGTSNRGQNSSQEGSIYEYWNGQAQSNRIKKYDSKNNDGVVDTDVNWWLRSSRSGDTGQFCYIYRNGACTSSNANTNNGVSFAFCV